MNQQIEDKKCEKPILRADSLFALARKLYTNRKQLYRSAIIGAVVWHWEHKRRGPQPWCWLLK